MPQPAERGTRPENDKIGLIPCVAFAVGTMIGAGVFVLSGLAVQKAGPAALASFVLAGVLVLLSALSFGVVASRARPGESGYAYVGRALGQRWRFLASWAFYVGGIIGVAFVLQAFGTYLHDFFVGGVSPVAWAVAAAVVLTLLNLGPADLIGRAEMALVGLKVAILLLLVGFGLAHLRSSELTPFAPHGGTSVVTTSALLFVAYLGFNVVCSMAPEVRDASRTIPRAIVISMALVAVVYLGVVVALLAAGSPSGGEAAVGRAAQGLIGHWGGVLIAVGALVSTLSAANANILGSSEIMVRLASTRDVPTVLGRMWRGHPAVSVLGGAALYVVLLLVGSAQTVVALANVAAIGAMAVINIGAAAAQRDHRSPGMRLPLGPVLPVLGVLTALAQLVFIPVPEILVGVGLLGVGLGIYALRHRMHRPEHHAQLQADVERGDTPAARAVGGRKRAGADSAFGQPATASVSG
jgi:amino acid transporter